MRTGVGAPEIASVRSTRTVGSANALDLRAQHAVEGEVGAVAAPQVRGAGQLEEKQRVAGRLARQDLGAALGIAGAARDQQLARPASARATRPPGWRAPAAPRGRRRASSCPPLSSPRRRAQRADQQKARRVRRAQHLRQQRQRVGVGPLQIVDVGDDRPPVRPARAGAGGRRRTSRRGPRAGRGRRTGAARAR